MEGIEISQGKVGARRDVAMLTVKGYVDTMTCSNLLSEITANLNKSIYHIVVDMAQVNYVSSAGWGIFVGEIKGIREKGGDLKIVQMTPEVYDVFEMLEFDKILTYYESIEEAINDFDLSIGLDISKSVKRSYTPTKAQEEKSSPSNIKRSVQHIKGDGSSPLVYEKTKVEPKNLPLTEKIKLIVIDDPQKGAIKITQILKTEKYGHTKINVFKLYPILRKLSLENKEKRNRFYRSR